MVSKQYMGSLCGKDLNFHFFGSEAPKQFADPRGDRSKSRHLA
jgi:hypothetical protein